jgi:hypothetical protein
MVDIMLFAVIRKHNKSVFTTSITAKDANGVSKLFFNMSSKSLKNAKNITFILQKTNPPIMQAIINKHQDILRSNER